MLEGDEAVVGVSADAFRSDLQEFLRLSNVSDKASLQAAADLYKGPALENLVCGEEPFDDWLRRFRDEIHERAIETHRRLGELLLGDTQLDQALRVARRVLELDPLSEPMCQIMITALVRIGHRSEAIRQYQHFKARFMTQLGVEPSPELRKIALDNSSGSKSITVTGGTIRRGEDSPRRSPSRSEPVIAVLPFELQAPDRSQDYLASGIAYDISTELGRFHCLTVLSRYSTSDMLIGSEPNFDMLLALPLIAIPGIKLESGRHRPASELA